MRYLFWTSPSAYSLKGTKPIKIKETKITLTPEKPFYDHDVT